MEADHNVARVERMTLGERRAVIERDGKAAWKWLEWSAMKVRFAEEVLRDAEADHARRKVEFDALAAALEENNVETRRLDEKIKQLEGALGLTGRRGTVAAAAATSARAAEAANGEAPESRAPPARRAPAPAKATKDDTDHLSDGYAKAYIKKPFFPVRKQRASAAAETPARAAARAEPSAPPLADPPTSSFFDEVVSGSVPGSAPSVPAAMPRVDSGASGASGASSEFVGGAFPDGFGDFSDFDAAAEPLRESLESGVTTSANAARDGADGGSSSSSAAAASAASPASVGLRASAMSEEERARYAAVERSRAEAAEARAAARQARERRASLASASDASFGGGGASSDAGVAPPETVSSATPRDASPAPIPPAFAHGDFADFSGLGAQRPSGVEGDHLEPSGDAARAPERASPPAPPTIPPPPGDVSAAAAAAASPTEPPSGRGPSAGPGPSPPDGSASANTAHENARAQMIRACSGLLPSPHAPRDGLTAHQMKLGPPSGDFCRPRFCSRACVAASCAGFIQACGGAAARNSVDLADVPAITKALKKIAIRNHPDRHSAARVGEAKAATATVLTQQVSFLQSMLEDFEYVPVRVAVSSGGAEPGTQTNETVVLPRVHLGATTAQLRDGVLEERPELTAVRESLGLALRSGPGAAESTVAVGATTLRELGVTKDSTFRMWTWTAAEKSWEAGFL